MKKTEETNPLECVINRLEKIEVELWEIKNPQNFDILDNVFYDFDSTLDKSEVEALGVGLVPCVIIDVKVDKNEYHFYREYHVIMKEERLNKHDWGIHKKSSMWVSEGLLQKEKE
jgi:hypothetical protein